MSAAIVFVIGLSASHAYAGTGSNQGVYGTNFLPATLTGQVTSSGVPIASATVSTIAGHLTNTDGSGNYTLHLNAPGIYSVTAQSGLESASDSCQWQSSIPKCTLGGRDFSALRSLR